MKKRTSFVIRDNRLLKNKFFSNDPKVIRDRQHACFVQLKKNLAKKGIDLSTQDINDPQMSEAVIYLDMPEEDVTKNGVQKLYLIINEPPAINSRSWDKKNAKIFDRVFTWYEKVIDNHKYFLLRFGYYFKFTLTKEEIKRAFDRKFCATIIGNKTLDVTNELYSERLKVIRWFNDNKKEEFDLYGQGWMPWFMPQKIKFLEQRFPTNWTVVNNLLFKPNYIYRGSVSSKLETLKKYKFAICFENIKGMEGFVTEKIFDCFSAGCVPIYFGAPNIKKLIPEECFIDYRKFNSPALLYKYLSAMSGNDYMKYLRAIKKFLSSKSAQQFGYINYANTISKYVVKDLAKL